MVRSRTTAFVFALFMMPLVALLVSACGGSGAERDADPELFPGIAA